MISLALTQDSRVKRIRRKHGSLGTKFFELVGEPSSGTVTEVRPLRAQLEASHPGVKDINVVRIMKSLGKAGFGKFIPGRGTKRSRFEWRGLSHGKAAAKTAPLASAQTAYEVNSAAPMTSPASGIVRHDTHRIIFRLRKDYTLDLELPSDLSSDEAQRLAKFILALPVPTET
jgi:hypothetical protein